MKVKEDSEKVGLKLNIQKTKMVASGPITLWQIDGETMETVRDFIFLESKITADDDCSHETKRCLFLGRKALTRSARHQWPQKAWMLEWHLSQGSGGLSTPARLTHLLGVEP